MYLSDIGEMFGGPYRSQFPGFTGRRLTLKIAMAAIWNYEMQLFERLVDGLVQVPGLKMWGIADTARFTRRTPTLAFTLSGFSPQEVAKYVGEKGVYVWDGDFYAQALIERLGLFETGVWCV
jgi:selenocysteine lyase/cysteine desulfurase